MIDLLRNSVRVCLLWSTRESLVDFSDSLSICMITETEWERLLNPKKTATHILHVANRAYHKQSDTEQHILHTLKCLSKLSKAEQQDWYIVDDVLYHMPTYDKMYHRYEPGDTPIRSGHNIQCITNKRTSQKERTQ